MFSWSVGGTIFLILLGLILRLVGVEYDLQKKEAAYRKILVIAEDDGTIRPKTIEELFDGVRSIHFLSYIRYLYFNIGNKMKYVIITRMRKFCGFQYYHKQRTVKLTTLSERGDIGILELFL